MLSFFFSLSDFALSPLLKYAAPSFPTPLREPASSRPFFSPSSPSPWSRSTSYFDDSFPFLPFSPATFSPPSRGHCAAPGDSSVPPLFPDPRPFGDSASWTSPAVVLFLPFPAASSGPSLPSILWSTYETSSVPPPSLRRPLATSAFRCWSTSFST